MASIQPLFLKAIDEALERATHIDLNALIEHVKNQTPNDVASTETIDARRTWLNAQPASLLGGMDADAVLERIISGNELQDITYLQKGVIAAKSVCRIAVRTPQGQSGWGTGFLIAPSILITNNHVLPSLEWAAQSQAQFRYERALDGSAQQPIGFRFLPQKLFFTHKQLDFSIVAVEETSLDKRVSLAQFGFLPLDGRAGKVAEGEWLTIIQHPAGELKQVCVRENQLLKRDDDVLWYSTDTLAGSSGSPVFSNDWQVVALHHSGVPKRKNGKIQTNSGQDFDPKRHTEQDVSWQANEGIRVSRIVQTLSEIVQTYPLVKTILSPPKNALLASSPSPSVSARQETSMSKTIDLKLEIGENGDVRIVSSSQESTLFSESAKKKKGTYDGAGNIIDAPADATFKGDHLKGYDPDFLGNGVSVHLPKLPEGATPAKLKDSDSLELKYEHFSIIQNAKRRLAYVSAANIDGGGRFTLSGRDDNWLLDSRIKTEEQLGPSYYHKNKLDRGHLTRREDLEFGTTLYNSVRSANGTNVYTNCAPQHEEFNQGFGQGIGGDNELWQGLELYLLEQTAKSKSLKICVFTGPVFDEADPVYRGIKIPLDYWKIIVGLNSENKPFATAYLLSQETLVDPSKLDESTMEIPFGRYKTYQVKVSLIAQLTGLKFGCKVGEKAETPLSKFDPLESPATKVRRRRKTNSGQAFESTMSADGALDSFDEIIFNLEKE